MNSVLSITATCGRHTILERCVAMFLNQDYQGEHALLIYNNSEISLSLDAFEISPNKKILLVNRCIDSKTGEKYSSLGAIYNDALTYIPKEYGTINHMDDDDLYLSSHISEGVKGLIRGGKKAYKPKYSFYRSYEGVVKSNNVLEPSIFLQRDWLEKYGYSLVTTEQHLQWLHPLQKSNELYVDEKGTSTLIYNWGDQDIKTFKSSGDPYNPLNFNNYRIKSKDHGDKIITPWPKEKIQQFLKNVTKS